MPVNQAEFHCDFLRRLKNKSSVLKKFPFKRISSILIPKSSKLHRYVKKVRKLYNTRYKCNHKHNPKIFYLIKVTVPKKTSLLSLSSRLNHKNYNFLHCDWLKKLLFSTNSLAKLLSDSLLLDSLLLDNLLSDS